MATRSTECVNQADMEPARQDITRVNLWCVPRSVSTAFLKCMTKVPDSQTWLEPYCLYRMYSKNSRHREMILHLLLDSWQCERGEKTMDFGAHIKAKGGYLVADKTRLWLKDQLEATPANVRCIFNKDMAYGLDGDFEDLPQGFQHTFLIRHPYRVFDSWDRMVNRGTMDESKRMRLTDQPECLMPRGYFFKEIYDLYDHVKKNWDSNPVIIDTDDLLANPGGVLKAYCQATGITYSDELLTWLPGRECMDETWMVAKETIVAQNAGNLHKETFESTGFGKLTKCPERSSLKEDVLSLSDPCMKYYEEMYENRLKC